jgi:heme/copper-type cytochrome/quinol oxidase subunit 3
MLGQSRKVHPSGTGRYREVPAAATIDVSYQRETRATFTFLFFLCSHVSFFTSFFFSFIYFFLSARTHSHPYKTVPSTSLPVYYSPVIPPLDAIKLVLAVTLFETRGSTSDPTDKLIILLYVTL